MTSKKIGNVQNLMTENRIFEPSDEFSKLARIRNRTQRDKLYRQSIEQSDEFWAEMAEKHIEWFKKWDAVEEYNFTDDIYIRYFRGARLNVSYNCLDRYLKTWRKNKAALIWQGEPAEESKTYTYAQLHREVSKFANVHSNRFKNTYFVQYPGCYFTGDGARKDKDGYYWLMGRVDDVINVSSHRLGTAEVESALVAHAKVAEAAVVGFPHDIKGEGIYAYVTLKEGIEPNEELKKELLVHVRKEIGPIATPDKIHFAPGLPKTRSGKIMRRILRKVAAGDIESLGDTSTLADPAVVDNLIKNRQ